MAFDLDVRGRQPTAVNQPPSGGSNYPLVRPSDDILYLFSDFYIAYEDPTCEYQLPFHLAWLHGFGENAVTPPSGWSTPTHDYDLILTDSLGAYVFDSTIADSFQTKVWDNRLLILEWLTDDAVCRAVIHTAWAPEDVDEFAQDYDDYIVPDNGELDNRTLTRMCNRVRSLRVGLTTLTASRVVWESGFNVGIEHLEEGDAFEDISNLQATLAADLATFSVNKPLVVGKRKTERVRLTATPGDGLGQVPGCEDVVPVLKQLAGIQPDNSGNLNFELRDCLRSQRPVGLVSEEPREFRHLSFDLEPDEARSALEVHNDCIPCCDCSYYSRTYKGLKRQWNLHSDIATDAEEVRDTYQDNIDRWLAEKDCRESNPLRVVFIPHPEGKIGGGIIWCNTYPCCAVPVVVRFTFQVYSNGEEVEDAGRDCQETEISGTGTEQGDEHYTLMGSWPVYEAQYDFIDPQDKARCSFKICIKNPQPGMNAQVTTTVHFPDEMETSREGVECDPVEAEVPEEIQAIWDDSGLGDPPWPTRAIKTSKLVPVEGDSGCFICNCE